MKTNPIVQKLDWWSLAGAAIPGILAPFFASLLTKKDKTMTTLEKAFTTLVGLLCQRLSESEETVEKLRKDLSDRPTRESFDLVVKQAEETKQVLGSERRTVQAQQTEIERLHRLHKSIKALEDAAKGGIRRRMKKPRVRLGGPRP